MTKEKPFRLAVVGAGWRAQFYMRLAQALPEHFDLVGVLARKKTVQEAVTAQFAAPTFTSLDDMVETTQPDYVVLSVPREVAPSLIRHLNKASVPVLSETPPAHHECGLRGLWKSLERPELVQIAEQYPMLPTHQARKAVVDAGTIGAVSSVHVSSTHDYHAVSLMRRYMGIGFEAATVRAQTTVAPLVDLRDRDGLKPPHTDPHQQTASDGQREPLPGQPKPALSRPARTTLATIEFGGRDYSRTGLYDFTDNQWHNLLRNRRILVRGSEGEIENDSVTHWDGGPRVLTSPILRSSSGHDLNLEGFDTQFFQFEGNVVWSNPYEGARLSDEEIAIATVMDQMGQYVRGDGPAPYPLEEALQDTAISLAIHRAAETGTEVTVAGEPWAQAT